MITNSFIVAAVVASGAILLLPRVANNPFWKATVTPLASIIGSGFLILGPILDHAFGGYAPLMMGVLCVVGYAFGSAIRVNIAFAVKTERGTLTAKLEALASWALAFAYVISVAYYLNLFGAFALQMTPFSNSTDAKILTTGVFILILVVGWTKGFSALERLEQFAVGLKLAIIAGLLVGLSIFFAGRVADNSLVFNAATQTGWGAITLGFGLIITIQGFETSRYLGNAYSADMRIRSMKFAQLFSSAIYMLYIIFIAYLFQPEDIVLSETAIIDMMVIVAPILPILLVAAALSAQFSAAIADTSGSGGLMHEIARGRFSVRQGYVLLVCLGVLLTWAANIFEIISYASRAFAVYYSLQAAIAAILIARHNTRVTRPLGYAVLCLLGILIALFGTSVE